jgi:hypothetical protein
MGLAGAQGRLQVQLQQQPGLLGDLPIERRFLGRYLILNLTQPSCSSPPRIGASACGNLEM